MSNGGKSRGKQEPPHVLIVGAGPTGLALAAALLVQQSQLSITIVDRGDFISVSRPLEPQNNARPVDSRVYSITPTNQRFLQSLGAWQLIDPDRISPVSAIEVCAPQRLRFDQYNDDGPLAWIVEHRAIANALSQMLSRAANDHLTMVERVGVSKIESRDGAHHVLLSNGSVMDCNLIIGADGKDSAIRGMFDFPTSYKPYNEIALVANWVCDKPHANVARQWFDAPGTLAFLPLPSQTVEGKLQHCVSMVWSLPAAAAQKLSSDEKSLAHAVLVATHRELGELKPITPLTQFPLSFLSVNEPIAPGVALIGDAAHFIHPLAGQGANLGLGDAQALANAINNRSALETPGAATVLRRYVRNSAARVLALQAATDGLGRLLSPIEREAPALQAAAQVLQQLAGGGMRQVNALAPLKRWIISKAS